MNCQICGQPLEGPENDSWKTIPIADAPVHYPNCPLTGTELKARVEEVTKNMLGRMDAE